MNWVTLIAQILQAAPEELVAIEKLIGALKGSPPATPAPAAPAHSAAPPAVPVGLVLPR